MILNEGANQIGKGLSRNPVAIHRAPQRDEHRMACLPGVHGVQLLAPPVEQAQALLLVADLVAEVVGPAAERVHIVEILMQAFRKQKTDHVEIFVMAGGQPTRVGLRLGDSVAGRHGLRRPYKLRRRERTHGMMAVLR